MAEALQQLEVLRFARPVITSEGFEPVIEKALEAGIDPYGIKELETVLLGAGEMVNIYRGLGSQASADIDVDDLERRSLKRLPRDFGTNKSVRIVGLDIHRFHEPDGSFPRLMAVLAPSELFPERRAILGGINDILGADHPITRRPGLIKLPVAALSGKISLGLVTELERCMPNRVILGHGYAERVFIDVLKPLIKDTLK